MAMNIDVKVWGKTPDGKDIKLYTLTNANGVKVQLSDIGAGIMSIMTTSIKSVAGLGHTRSNDSGSTLSVFTETG